MDHASHGVKIYIARIASNRLTGHWTVNAEIIYCFNSNFCYERRNCLFKDQAGIKENKNNRKRQNCGSELCSHDSFHTITYRISKDIKFCL